MKTIEQLERALAIEKRALELACEELEATEYCTLEEPCPYITTCTPCLTTYFREQAEKEMK
jgi:hypothetical protein